MHPAPVERRSPYQASGLVWLDLPVREPDTKWVRLRRARESQAGEYVYYPR